MEPNQTTPTEPTPTQNTEPTLTTDPVAPVGPTSGDPVVEPAPVAEPVAAPVAAEPAAAVVPPAEPTEPEPAATEPVEPDVRVVPKPSEYELPEGMPDQLRIFANENGFTQEQLTTTLEQFGGYMQGMQQHEQSALRTMGEAHLKNWGADSNTKLALAKQALKQNDPDGGLAKALEDSGYGNHPAVLDFLHNIGKSMQEGGFLKSTVQVPPGKKTAAQAMYGEGITKKQ